MGLNRATTQGKVVGKWAFLCPCDGGLPGPKEWCRCGRRGRSIPGRMRVRDQRRTARKWWLEAV